MVKKLILVSMIAAFAYIGVSCANKIIINDQEDKALIELLNAAIEVNHFNPVKVNDKFSQEAFDLYLDRLDQNKRYLLKDDVESLLAYRNKIDDEIASGDFQLLKKSVEMLEKQIEFVESIYPKILEKPFDFDKEEMVELDEEKLDYAENKKELKDRWRKILKYQVLNKIVDKEEQLEKLKEKNDTSYHPMTFEEIEEWARGKVLKSTTEIFNRIDKVEFEDRRNLFINALVEVNDPHTSYFPPKDKENFDIDMSGQLEGIGATLREKEGYISVVNIVPGSASWKQGELQEEDVILKVGQGSEEPVDIVDMRLDNAVKLIRGPKGTEVRLTIKKLDGSIKEISIIRDVVIIEAAYAKSSIIEEGGKKIGMIHLPKFYADFGNKEGRTCSKDVAIEVGKLKREGVDGIVIDLRNNGGGSLQDVVDMMDLFIADGPVVQIKSKNGKPYVLSGNDRGSVAYDGDLVIMVNSFSASASEILAAAVQDYKRGVIVGTKSTFGKGTVQRFYDLNKMVRTTNGLDLGALKITTQKFYRINGGATQLKGVIPDIVLPDIYAEIEVGEREMDHAMEWDEIDPEIYDYWKKKIDLANLKSASDQRTDTTMAFQIIEKNAQWLKEQRDETKYPLNYKQFVDWSNAREESAKAFDQLDEYKNSFQVSFPKDDQMKMKSDSAVAERLNKWKENLESDPYVGEVFNIFKDLGNTTLND